MNFLSTIDMTMRDLKFSPIVRQEHQNDSDFEHSVALDPSSPLFIGMLITNYKESEKDDLIRSFQDFSFGYFVAYEYSDVVHEATSKNTLHKSEQTTPTVTDSKEGILISTISHVSIDKQFYYTPLRLVISIRIDQPLHKSSNKLSGGVESDVRSLMDINRYRPQSAQERVVSTPVVFVQSLSIDYHLREVSKDMSILSIRFRNSFPIAHIEIDDIVFHTDRMSLDRFLKNSYIKEALDVDGDIFSISLLNNCSPPLGGRGMVNGVTIAPQEEHTVLYGISLQSNKNIKMLEIAEGKFSVPLTVYWSPKRKANSAQAQRGALVLHGQLSGSTVSESAPRSEAVSLEINKTYDSNRILVDDVVVQQLQHASSAGNSSSGDSGSAVVAAGGASSNVREGISCELNSTVTWTLGNTFTKCCHDTDFSPVMSSAVDIVIQGPSIVTKDAACTLKICVTNNTGDTLENAVLFSGNRPMDSTSVCAVQDLETLIGSIAPGATMCSPLSIIPLQTGRLLFSNVHLTSSSFQDREFHMLCPFDMLVEDKLCNIEI